MPAGSRDRESRNSRATTIVWLGVLAVSVATVIAAFVVPLPESSGSASASTPGGRSTPGATPAPTASAAGNSPSPSPSTRPAAKVVSIAAGGDVMGAWGVDSVIRSRGADYVLKDLKPVLSSADAAFVNAEGPFSSSGSAQTWKDVYFRGNPALVLAMAKAGIDVVTMANNHCLDYKAPALLDSVNRFSAKGIQVVGAGRNATEAWKFRYVKRKGVTIGFMGWTDIMPPGYAATASGAGAAVGPLWSGPSRYRTAIRKAAKKADVVVVAFHWGIEGQHSAIGQQIQEAHAAIDAGADLVMSHHPHWLQGIERYHGGMIMYSFGDLVFPPLSEAAAETVILTNTVSPRWITTTITPYHLDGNGVPHRATGAMGLNILRQLDSYSRSRGTTISIDTGHITATVKVKRRL